MSKKYYIYQMDVKTLNILSVLIFLSMLVLTYLLNSDLLFESFYVDNYFLFILMVLLYTCLHEILHSIAYVLHGAKFKNITYGMAFEKGIFYCLCKQKISKKNILISLLYPFVFIGILTYVIAIVFHIPLLVLLSVCNIGGCVGDLIMFNFIYKLNNIEFSEFDDETSFGIYTSEDISSKKCFGLKYITSENKLNILDYKKIKISKGSYIVLFCLLFFGLISYIIK